MYYILKFIRNIFYIIFTGNSYNHNLEIKILDNKIDDAKNQLNDFKRKHPHYFNDSELRKQYYQLLSLYASAVENLCEFSGYNDSDYGYRTLASRKVIQSLLSKEREKN